MLSAFGVEDPRISKADDKHRTDSGRLAAGTLLPGFHGAVAGRKGKKLRAAGNEIGGSLAGTVAGGIAGGLTRNPGVAAALASGGYYGGAAAGTVRAERKGYYKPLRNDS